MSKFEKLFKRLVEHHGEEAKDPKRKKWFDGSLGDFLTKIGDAHPLYASIESKVGELAENDEDVNESSQLTEGRKKYGEVNPWAVCTKSTGRKNKKKYEKCVRKVKKSHEVAK